MKLGDTFTQRSAALREAYRAAKTAQWTVDDFEWGGDGLTPAAGGLDADARAARGNLAAAFHLWSNALLGASSRLAATHENADAQMLLAVHVHDYARHVEVWRRYLEHLGVAGRVPRETADVVERFAQSEAVASTAELLAVWYHPCLQVVYAGLSAQWKCALGRAVCTQMAADLARHQQDLLLVCAHTAPAPAASRATLPTLPLLGLEVVLMPDCGAEPVHEWGAQFQAAVDIARAAVYPLV